MWTSDGRLVVCGPEDRGWDFSVPGGGVAVGVRLRPGALPSLLGVPAYALANDRPDVAAVLGPRGYHCAARLNDSDTDSERVNALTDLVGELARDAGTIDPLARRAATLLDATPSMRVGVAAATVGLSERQLRRRSLDAFGFAPAVVRRVRRLHRFVSMGRAAEGTATISELAHRSGYFDHQHLVREAREIGRATPGFLVGRDRSVLADS